MPALIPVGNILGAFFIGVILSSILYGVTCLQVYSYFSQHCKNDRVFLKSFVALLLIVDSLQLILVVHGFYVAGVINFGDYLADSKAPWSLKVQSLLGIILSCSVQQFYAWRIYQLSMRQAYIPIFIFILSLAELGLGVVYLVHCFQFPYFTQAKVQIPNSTAGLSIQVACDLTITVSMVYYLFTRHDTIAKRANLAITTVLALYCINSGALTLIFAVACLATFVRYSHTLIYAPFFFVLVRLYACAFMAVLNSRDRLRISLQEDAEPRVEKGTMIAFHGISTLGHIGDSDVISTSIGGPNTNAVGDPRFATQSTISGVSGTKVSTLRLTESEWRDVVALNGTKAEHERRTSCEA